MSDQTQGIIPHLVVRDASGAIEFYKQGLGATEVMWMPAEDGKRLMHAEVTVNGARLFLADFFPEYCSGESGRTAPPTELGGTAVTMHLEVPDCDAAVARAEAAGATVIMAPWDAFWGARYAQIADPYGHTWSFANPLPVGAETGVPAGAKADPVAGAA